MVRKHEVSTVSHLQIKAQQCPFLLFLCVGPKFRGQRQCKFLLLLFFLSHILGIISLFILSAQNCEKEEKK